MTARSHRVRAGFTLAEALLATVILLIAITAITLPFAAGARAEQADARMCLAVSLAQEMMEEILAKPFLDPQGATEVGPDAGETRRARFDNVDDYHGYYEGSRQIADATGALLTTPIATGLTRQVTCQYVYVSGQDTTKPATFVRVIVTVAYNGSPLVTLTRLVYKMPS
jgi:Tfp pilus assembly protein PilV